MSALLFLYRNVVGRPLEALGPLPRGRVPTTLPVVLTAGEVARVVGGLRGVYRLVGLLLYGSGLRLTECLMLRIKDVDFDRGQLAVRRGKGGKDRVTVLPETVQRALQEHVEVVRASHLRDLTSGGGWVELPGGLAAKYPRAGASWPWQWVFPARRRRRDPDSGRVRRHHLDESAVQRAMTAAVRASGIAKRASCHTLRHSFATHLLEAGYDSHGAGATRAPGRVDHDDLHPRSGTRGQRGPESGGRVGSVSGCSNGGFGCQEPG